MPDFTENQISMNEKTCQQCWIANKVIVINPDSVDSEEEDKEGFLLGEKMVGKGKNRRKIVEKSVTRFF